MPSDALALPATPATRAPRGDAIGWLLLLAIEQVGVMLLVRPSGEFAVNDDWVYALAVRWLVEQHRLAVSPWSAATALPQVLLGAAASAALGYSLELLRHVTQLAALAASIAVFACLRALALRARDAALGALVLVANPCWPVLASSFMSDVYGVLFVAAATALYLRDLAAPSRARLAGAVAFTVLGVLERQVVAVLPLAFAAAQLARRSRGSPGTRASPLGGRALRGRALRGRALSTLRALAPLAVTLAALAAAAAWMGSGESPGVQHYYANRLATSLLHALTLDGTTWAQVGANAAGMTAYLGLFCAGWMAWWGMPRARPRSVAATLAAGALLACVLLGTRHWAPFHADNVLDAAGIGPFTLYDALPRGLFHPDRAPGLVWPVATVVAALGAAGLVALALVTARRLWRWRQADARQAFCALAVLGLLAPFALTDYFDRYLLPAVPLLCALWALAWPRPAVPARNASGYAGHARVQGASAPARIRARQASRRAAGKTLAIAWLVLSGGLAAFATHDYFAWNRARAAAIAAAERRGATPLTLDGGYEYNGYHRLYAGMVPRVPGKSWWWVEDDRYIVTFGTVPGYREVASFAVDRWLARTPAAVHLLERDAP